MQTIIVLLLFGCSVLYLCYIKAEGIERLSPPMKWGTAASKHVLALFTAVFGANAVGLLLSLPFLAYAYLTHTEAGIDVFAALMDRPYFPLQVTIAFAIGLMTFRWFKEGGVRLVWILPVIQAVVAVAVFVSRFNPKGWDDYWAVFFDWGCGCSATLPQWTVMLPLYTSVAFAIGASIRGGFTASKLRSAAHA